MRPPTGVHSPGGTAFDQHTKPGTTESMPDPKRLNDEEKEANRQVQRYNRAWKRLRPNMMQTERDEKSERDDIEDE